MKIEIEVNEDKIDYDKISDAIIAKILTGDDTFKSSKICEEITNRLYETILKKLHDDIVSCIEGSLLDRFGFAPTTDNYYQSLKICNQSKFERFLDTVARDKIKEEINEKFTDDIRSALDKVDIAEVINEILPLQLYQVLAGGITGSLYEHCRRLQDVNTSKSVELIKHMMMRN